MNECRGFRDDLARALEGGDARPLAAHGHLLCCAVCRDLLESEAALDELLAAWPRVALPADLARRVLERLRGAWAADELDRLLARTEGAEAPSDLAPRLLAGLAAARADARLDALLGRVPEAASPAGLAARVLAGLAAERAGARGAPHLLRLPGARARLAAAAAVLLCAGALVLWRARGTAALPAGIEGLERGVDPELLQALDALENWDVVASEDLDLWMAELGPVDWTLLELGDDADGGTHESTSGSGG